MSSCDDMFICEGKKVSELSFSCQIKLRMGKCERARKEPPFEGLVGEE